MPIFDFLNKRDGQQQTQQTEQPQPETYKQSKTREAIEDKANAKPPDHNMNNEQRGVIADVQKTVQGQSGQDTTTPVPSPSPVPAGATNPQPMQQQGISDDKVAPEMSPTSGLASSRAQDVEGPSAPSPTPSPTRRTEQSFER